MSEQQAPSGSHEYPPLLESYWPADTASADLLDTTLGDLLRRAAAEVPDRIALVEGIPDAAARRQWTYAELLAEAERTARALLTRFAPGERVAVYAPNCPEWTLLQHGMSLAGLVLVPLNPAYKADEVQIILGGCEAVGIFFTPAFRDNDTSAVVTGLTLPHLRERICFDDLDAFVAGGDPAAPLPEVSPEDVLQIQYTSGTTGTPKGALLHHRGVINTCRYVAQRAAFTDGGVWLNAMPLFHIGGSAVTSIGCLSHRGTYVLAPGFDPASTLELTESEGAHTMLVVPTMILAMLDHPDRKERDLASIRTICSGASAVAAALVTRTKAELDCEFTILFGQTEINGVVCQTRIHDTLADQTETLGRPLPHAEVKVADPETGKVRPIGEVGEICVRGYQTMQGYYGEPAATAATLRADGWLHMGDLGTMDERGYLRITGRLKDMIIRGGMNLFPREIEDVVAQAPGVAQIAVVGVPDERWGEVIGAVVIPSDPANPPSPEDLNAFCRERLAAHKSPRHYYLTAGYPLTPSGKIQKFRLQELIADGSLGAVGWTPPGTDEGGVPSRRTVPAGRAHHREPNGADRYLVRAVTPRGPSRLTARMDSRWNTRTVTANGMRIHLVEAGSGPLVLLCHGFPESWYSWRHQLNALADAGYRAVAMDMRGYGRSSKPAEVEAYVVTEIVADCVGVVEALGETQAVIVGHDWGAGVAWTAAWTRPDVFRAVAALSVPFGGRGIVALPNNPLGERLTSVAQREIAGEGKLLYQELFRGSEISTEIEADVASWIAGTLYGFSGSVPLPPEIADLDFLALSHDALAGFVNQAMCIPVGGQLRDLMPPLPDRLPGWLSTDDLAFYTGEFERSGLQGGLNYYACLDRDWELLAQYEGTKVTVPSLYIGADRDIVTIWAKRAIELHAETQADFRGNVIVAGSGHWIQQEQPEATNAALLDFLKQI